MSAVGMLSRRNVRAFKAPHGPTMHGEGTSQRWMMARIASPATMAPKMQVM